MPVSSRYHVCIYDEAHFAPDSPYGPPRANPPALPDICSFSKTICEKDKHLLLSPFVFIVMSEFFVVGVDVYRFAHSLKKAGEIRTLELVQRLPLKMNSLEVSGGLHPGSVMKYVASADKESFFALT